MVQMARYKWGGGGCYSKSGSGAEQVPAWTPVMRGEDSPKGQLPLSPLDREQHVLSSHKHPISAGYYSSISQRRRQEPKQQALRACRAC